MSATETGDRNEARSIIEELWAEREQSRSTPTPPVLTPAPRPAKPRRAPAPALHIRERALATAIVLILVGNLLGIGAKALGLIGGASKATFLAEADAIAPRPTPSWAPSRQPVATRPP